MIENFTNPFSLKERHPRLKDNMAQVNYPGLERINAVKQTNKFLRMGYKKDGSVGFGPVAPSGITRAGDNVVYLPAIGIAGTEADLRAWLAANEFSAQEINKALAGRVTKANYEKNEDFKAMLAAHKATLESARGEKSDMDFDAFVDSIVALNPTKGDALKITAVFTDAGPKRARKVVSGKGTRKHDYVKQLENMRIRNKKGTGTVQVLDVSKLDVNERGEKFNGNTFVKAINKPANIKTKIPLPAPYSDVVASSRVAALAFLDHVGRSELIDQWQANAESAKNKVVSSSKPAPKPSVAKGPVMAKVSPKPVPGAVKPASNARVASPARSTSPGRPAAPVAAKKTAAPPAKKTAAPPAGRPGRI